MRSVPNFDVLAGQMSAPGRIRTCDTGFRRACQALLVVASKGVLSWLYRATGCQLEPRRVADSPTKHRPQISDRLPGLGIERRPRMGGQNSVPRGGQISRAVDTCHWARN